MSRAAPSRAARIRASSLVVAPVIITSFTRTSDESRNHSPPPTRTAASSTTATKPRRKGRRSLTSGRVRLRGPNPFRGSDPLSRVHSRGLTPDQAPAERVDVPGAEGQDEVALSELAPEEPLGGVEAGQPGDGAATGVVRRRRGDEPTGDAREVLRPLARRIDLEHHDEVGERQRRAELAELVASAREQVRLEHGDDAPRAEGAGGRDRRAHLGRV